MSSVKKQAPLFHVGDWVAFHYGPKKVSAKVVEDRGRSGVRGARLYRVQLDEVLGEESAFEMPENELETTAVPVRQAYKVKYSRQGKANVWRATTRRQGLRKGVKAKGAVGFTTGAWEGESADDPGHAIVSVLMEVDPRSSELGDADDSDARRELAERARGLADEMFLSRHPRAKIEHALSAE
jgi:hypothetical protein